VKVAVPAATVLSGFVKRAVMVAVPGAAPVANPVEELMVTILVLLELHATRPLKFSVTPVDVVPIAKN
jgi:hypothetical protein